MAYADPQATHNPSPGTSPPASWGDILRDDHEWTNRNKPHARAYNNANISIANGAVTAVLLNSERVDVGGMHSTSSNTSRLTVPSGGDGWYTGMASASLASNATGYRICEVRLNGSTVIASDIRGAVSGGTTDFTIPWDWQMVAGDYVEMCVFQTSGGNLNLVFTVSSSPEFSAMWQCV